MNFTTFGVTAFVSGLAVLAASLFALQRLRVRHKDVVVVTTLFWPREIEETRARVLVERFRRPWVYALLLAIAALLWTSVGAPRFGTSDARERVILIDGSARAAVGGRLADSIALAAERVAECPATTTRVLLAGARIRTVLEPGEAPELLAKRLAGVNADACPSTLERALAELAAVDWRNGLVVEVVGGVTVASDAIAALPPGIEVAALEMASTAKPEHNVGIVALGVTEAASGSYSNVDLFVALARTDGAEWRDPRAVLRGGGVESPLVLTLQDAGGEEWQRRYVARDVPAAGGSVAIDIGAGDDLAADDTASHALPARPRLAVAVEADAPAAIVAALHADPAVDVVANAADAVLAVRRAGSAFGARLPALVLTAASDDGAAFRVKFDAGDSSRSDAMFSRVVDELALREIDAASLATTAGREIRAEAQIGEPLEPRAIEVWEVLFGAEYDFAQSAAFPRFVAEALRFLADVEPLVSEVAAGRPIREPRGGAELLERGRELATLGDVVVPPRIDQYVRADGRVVHASLLDLATTIGADRAAATLPRVHRDTGFRFDPASLALAAAFVLLIAEWFLLKRERIP